MESQAPTRIDVISDVICPWCYIGRAHLEGALALMAKDGLHFDIAWHPFQLNPDMPEEGVERSAYRAAKFGSAERAAEMDARVVEAGTAAGVTIRPHLMRRTPNTLAAHRVIWLALQHGVQHAVKGALLQAYFSDGADIGQHDSLASIAATAGLPAAETRAMLASEDGRAEVLAEDAMARNAGINGVPSFIMGRHILFSGAQPADAMADTFTRAYSILSRNAA